MCCTKHEDRAQPPPSASASAKPVDRLEPNELAESDVTAFELKLPRGMTIQNRGPSDVYAVGDLQPEHVANYIRKHVLVDAVELGAVTTVFDRVKVLGATVERPVRIEVIRLKGHTGLLIKSLLPEKVEIPPTEEERWKRVGLTPNGLPIDPLKME
jgi:hypothetical protein